jgi:hypothetical protein
MVCIPLSSFQFGLQRAKIRLEAIRASAGISDFFGTKWQNPSLEHVLVPPEEPLAVKFWKHTFLPLWSETIFRIS